MATRTNSNGVGLAAIAAIVAIVAMGFMFESFREDDARTLELNVMWTDRVVDTGVQARDWGENPPTRVKAPERAVAITYWVDGMPTDVSEAVIAESHGVWQQVVNATPGTTVRVQAHQTQGGFLLCNVVQDGAVVDHEHRNDPGSCQATWTVSG